MLAVALLAVASAAQAVTILSDSEVLASSTTLQQLLPATRTFNVTTAGTLEVTAADIGAPAALTSLKVLVTRGGVRVAKLDAAGVVQFSAAPGAYKVQVLGSVAGATPGSFTVNIRDVAASATILTFSDDITPAPAAPVNPAESRLDDTFAITQAGSYTLTITDLNLPSALSSIDLIVLKQGGGVITTNTGPCSPVCQKGPFSLTTGTYDIGGFVTAAAGDKAGLYSVIVSGGAGAVVYSKTMPVGLMPAARTLSVSAAAGTLALSDFASPVALSALQGRLVQGANALATLNAAGSTGFTAPSAGAAQLYVFARPGGTAGAGAYGSRVTQGSVLLDDARPIPEGYVAANNIGGYRFPVTIPTAGTYVLQLHDYAFPATFAALRALVVQNANQALAVAGAASTSGTLAAGAATVLVFGVPPNSNSNSLVGFTLTPQPGTSPVLEQTQGVGGLFRTRNVSISTPGSYDLTLTDLQFPDAFGEIAAAFTQGSTLKGQILGGGKLTFNVPSGGTYSLNILARMGNAASYGSYGIDLASTPPAPVITFTASAATVGSGQTATLQWSATDATTCNASGGWSGARTSSGTETTAALTSATTYTLSCTGPGGSSNKSVTVSVSAGGGSSGGGGGRVDLTLLMLGAGLVAWRVLRLRESADSRRQPSTRSLR